MMSRQNYSKKFIARFVGGVGLTLFGILPVQAQLYHYTLTNSTPITQVPATISLDIIDTIVSAGEFTILTQALQAADLVDTIKGEGPFTLFAPTDKAFSALPPGVLSDLLKPENKAQLVKILTSHVVAGKVLSTDLKSGEVQTLEGNKIKIELGTSVKVNNATVIKADVSARNGVIHVIDAVILPE